MSIFSKILEKCSLMQWGIGLANGSISDVIRKKNFSLNFTWMPQNNKLHFIADPFIFKNKQGNINVLYEDFSLDKDGVISLTTLNQNFEPIFKKQLLKTNSHLSYPFIFEDFGITYIIPESYQRGYVWDNGRASRLIESLLMNIPIPACYFAEEEGGVLTVIDGQQRLYSIWRYVRDHFKLKGLRMAI